MKPEGIYVEIPISVGMDELWEYTQNPALHQQWDLRFSHIEYLPRQREADVQRFRYATRVGFGIQVVGEGESVGTRHSPDGSRTSSLKFWSDAPISLIQAGSGYWKYIPTGDTVRFLTWYDYQVRFGVMGRWIDGLVFRPLMGRATAWSFDALRLWLERGVHPAHAMRRAYVHLTAQLALAGIWVYQGLVPKLLFPASGELAILRATGMFTGVESAVVVVIGVAQIIFGLLFLVFGLSKWLHYLNIAGLLALGVGAFVSQNALFVAPFNPAGLTTAMVALSLISLLNMKDLPRAANCLRKPRVR